MTTTTTTTWTVPAKEAKQEEEEGPVHVVGPRRREGKSPVCVCGGDHFCLFVGRGAGWNRPRGWENLWKLTACSWIYLVFLGSSRSANGIFCLSFGWGDAAGSGDCGDSGWAGRGTGRDTRVKVGQFWHLIITSWKGGIFDAGDLIDRLCLSL